MYNKTVMDHFRSPRNVGVIEDADGVGEVGAVQQPQDAALAPQGLADQAHEPLPSRSRMARRTWRQPRWSRPST